MPTDVVFYKMQGAGNDFIIIESSSKGSDKNKKSKNQKIKKSRKKMVMDLCDRHFGIGADGVVFLERPENKTHTYKWDFYNSDGSSAEACMNASRCVVLFAERYSLQRKSSSRKHKTPIVFETKSGLMKGRVLKSPTKSKKISQNEFQVELELLNNFSPPEEKTIEIQKNKKIKGFFVNTGVPHFVVIQDYWAPSAWREEALQIQTHPAFSTSETNVTFIQIHSRQKTKAITLERGVGDFTLACGTGAAAAAWTLMSLQPSSSVVVQMPGGDLLFYTKNQQNFLSGPAALVYKGHLTLK